MSSWRPRSPTSRAVVRPHGARLDHHGPDIPRAVTDQRQRLLGERGEHELSLRTRFKHRTGHRIDRLDQEVVLLDVQPVADGTFGGHTRPAHFRQPVEVERGQPERLLNLAPHGLRPRLPAEQPERQA